MGTTAQETPLPTVQACEPTPAPEVSEGRESPQIADQPAAQAGARTLRLVVVEDNASDVELIKHALRKGGFEVECVPAQTAEDFKSAIRKGGYDIVLAD